MDTLSPKERSRLMSLIRSKHTKPETRVQQALAKMGIPFESHARDLPGTPDIVIFNRRIVIEVRGCFWHGHKCAAGRRPTSNRTFWDAKIATNVSRDRRNARLLRLAGWKVRTLWTCRLRGLGPEELVSVLKSRMLR